MTERGRGQSEQLRVEASCRNSLAVRAPFSGSSIEPIRLGRDADLGPTLGFYKDRLFRECRAKQKKPLLRGALHFGGRTGAPTGRPHQLHFRGPTPAFLLGLLLLIVRHRGSGVARELLEIVLQQTDLHAAAADVLAL